jgi:hypothetical protein
MCESTLSENEFENVYLSAIIQFISKLTEEEMQLLAKYLAYGHAHNYGDFFGILISFINKRLYTEDLQRTLLNRVCDFLVFLYLKPPYCMSDCLQSVFFVFWLLPLFVSLLALLSVCL